MQDNIYLCGIGDGSFAAHQAARRMASEWSGLMTFGDLNGDLNAEHTALRGESDQGEVELKVMGMAAQLPVWMSMTAKTQTTPLRLTSGKSRTMLSVHRCPEKAQMRSGCRLRCAF